MENKKIDSGLENKVFHGPYHSDVIVEKSEDDSSAKVEEKTSNVEIQSSVDGCGNEY